MQKAQTYTILVEAKDHGEKVQLSSTSTVILNIIDKPNYPNPEFVEKTVSKQNVSAFEAYQVLLFQSSDAV